MEENNNISGPVEPSTATPSNIVSLDAFRDKKTNTTWPSASTPGEDVTITASPRDPTERRILLSLLHGDVVMDGFLGLSQTFLVIGDGKGQIKFAAAPGNWLYAKDVTDDPDFQDNSTE